METRSNRVTSTVAPTQGWAQPAHLWISHLGGQNYGPELLNNFMLYFWLCLSVPSVPPRKQSDPRCAGAAPAVLWAGAEAGAGALAPQQTLTSCAVKSQGSSFHLTALCRTVMEGNTKTAEANTAGNRRAHFWWILVVVAINVGFFICAKTYLDLACLSVMRASACAPPSAWPSTSTPHSSNAPLSSHCSCQIISAPAIQSTCQGKQASKKLEIMCNSTSLSVKSLLSHAGLYQSSRLWVFPSQEASAAGASEKHFAVLVFWWFMVIHEHTPSSPYWFSMCKDGYIPLLKAILIFLMEHFIKM